MSVLIVSPDIHLGGLSSGGLSYTDVGRKSAIGGLAREFYHRVWLHYQQPSAWRWEDRAEFGGRGQGLETRDDAHRTMWLFQPHAAEAIFEELTAAARGSADGRIQAYCFRVCMSRDPSVPGSQQWPVLLSSD